MKHPPLTKLFLSIFPPTSIYFNASHLIRFWLNERRWFTNKYLFEGGVDVLTVDYIERISGCFRWFTRVVTFDVTKTKKQSAQCQVLFNFFQKLKEESNKFHFIEKLTKPDFDIPFITPIVGLGNTFLPKTRFFFGLQTTACLQNSKGQFSSSHCKKLVDNSFYAELWSPLQISFLI